MLLMSYQAFGAARVTRQHLLLILWRILFQPEQMPLVINRNLHSNAVTSNIAHASVSAFSSLVYGRRALT
mgnify:CR=1 FL=1